jgi:hypothetical protein
MLLNVFSGFPSLIEIVKAVSAISTKLPNPFPQSQQNRLIRGLIETTKCGYEVPLKPRKPTISKEYLKFLSKFEATALSLGWIDWCKKQAQNSHNNVSLRVF